MLTVGSVVSGYRIERVLGRGGMGAVYLVANPELPRREALKLMSVDLSRDPGFRARFLREAEVASRLEHPNIVPIYRRGETDEGQLWISMQFVDGTDADDETQGNRMPPARAVHIIGEVAKALDYAHRNGVIHRDVKPANFLLSGPASPEERVLLADFGIARALTDASLTGTGEMVATLAYAAPEVINGDPATGAADQYSLACALFRMLTGHTPFADAESQPAVMMAHLQRPAPPPSKTAPWLPPALDAVIATGLAKDPRQRYPSCGQFVDSARAALHLPSVVGPPAAPVPAERAASAVAVHRAHLPPLSPRRNRATIITALVSTAVVAATAIGATVWVARRSGHAGQPVAVTPTTSVTPATTVVPAEMMESILLTNDELSAVAGESMKAVGPVEDFMDDALFTVSPESCSSIFQNAGTSSTYADSNWTIVRKTAADSIDGSLFAIQAIISYPTATSAQKAYSYRIFALAACGNASGSYTSKEKGFTIDFTADNSKFIGQLLSVSAQVFDSTHRRFWVLHNQLIIEVGTISDAPTDRGVKIINRILSKIPS